MPRGDYERHERRARAGRRQLRGRPLLPQCSRAHISKNESPGVDACYGLTDADEGIYNQECRECGALVWNYDMEHEAARVFERTYQGTFGYEGVTDGTD